MVNRWILANDLATVLLITKTVVALNHYFHFLYQWWQGSVHSLPNLGISQQLGVRIVSISQDVCSATTLSVGAFCLCFVLVINGDRRCKPRGYNPVWTLVLRAGADCVAVHAVSLKYCVGTLRSSSWNRSKVFVYPWIFCGIHVWSRSEL